MIRKTSEYVVDCGSSVLQCGAVCCAVLQCVAVDRCMTSKTPEGGTYCCELPCVARRMDEKQDIRG